MRHSRSQAFHNSCQLQNRRRFPPVHRRSRLYRLRVSERHQPRLPRMSSLHRLKRARHLTAVSPSRLPLFHLSKLLPFSLSKLPLLNLHKLRASSSTRLKVNRPCRLKASHSSRSFKNIRCPVERNRILTSRKSAEHLRHSSRHLQSTKLTATFRRLRVTACSSHHRLIKFTRQPLPQKTSRNQISSRPKQAKVKQMSSNLCQRLQKTSLNKKLATFSHRLRLHRRLRAFLRLRLLRQSISSSHL